MEYKSYFLFIIFILVVVDMLLTATAVVNFGAYENSWLHRWGFKNFGHLYTGLGIVFSFLIILGVSEFGGMVMSYFALPKKEYYFLILYAGIIILYSTIIILNALVIYTLQK